MDHGIEQRNFQKTRAAMNSGLGKLRDALYTAFVPQDAADVGLMLIGGPTGKLGRGLVAMKEDKRG